MHARSRGYSVNKEKSEHSLPGLLDPGRMGDDHLGGKLPEERWSQGEMTNQDDTARRWLPRQLCWTPGQGRRGAKLPGGVSDELDCSPAGSSLDSENPSKLREDFPRLMWAKGLGLGPHGSWKEPKESF